MPTRNINLTDHYDSFVSDLLNTGRFSNASEVIRAGLRLLESQNREEQARIAALRDAFKEGMDDHERGEFLTLKSEADIDRFFDDANAEIERAS